MRTFELVSATYLVYPAELGDAIVDTRGGALPCSGAIAGSIEPWLALVGPSESDHEPREPQGGVGLLHDDDASGGGPYDTVGVHDEERIRQDNDRYRSSTLQ